MIQQTNQPFKIGEKVWVKSLKTEARMYVYLDSELAKVEVKVDYDKETKIRQTKLETVKIIDLSPYREKKVNSKSRKPLQIKVKYFDNEIEKLEKISIGDWIDLRAAETIELKQFDFKLIPLGVGMKLPKGYEANIVPRSSTFKNFGILQTNSYGVIDNSYSGNNDQYHFPALAMRDTVIKKGDRICQFRINRVMPDIEIEIVEQLDEVSRGGFGTTGTK